MQPRFAQENREKPFENYDEYMKYMFACVNNAVDEYLTGMKEVFANEQGGYKNVLYPDLEIAHDVCKDHVSKFLHESDLIAGEPEGDYTDTDSQDESDLEEGIPEDLLSILGAFASETSSPADNSDWSDNNEIVSVDMSLHECMEYIKHRALLTQENGTVLPFFGITQRLEFTEFTTFCFTAAVLSSTQTDYAGIFQVVNENSGLTSPTIESAARLYYGKNYSITGGYGQMSKCLEQLKPLLNLRVVTSMPFSTSVSLDKRVIDFLFGTDPGKLDQDFMR